MQRRSTLTHFPGERGLLPPALAVVLQAAALLALVTIVRDLRPHPDTEREAWERLGAFPLLATLTAEASLFVFVAVTAAWAMADIPPQARARECARVLVVLAVGVTFVAPEVLAFGAWKGEWQLFGPMAAVAVADLALTFAALRWLDHGEARGARHGA